VDDPGIVVMPQELSMNKLLLPVAAAALLGVGFVSAPVSAAPVSGVQIATPDTGVSEVRTTRHEMHRRHMTRRSMMRSRRAAPSQAGNARDAQRPVMQQQQGQTTGGPRY
jgi:hypothetical protein